MHKPATYFQWIIMKSANSKIVSLVIAVAFFSGCAAPVANPVLEASDQLRQFPQAASISGRTDNTEQLLMQSIVNGTINPAEGAYQLGHLSLNDMDYEGADRFYKEAVNLQPNNLLYLDAAGFTARETGQYAKAESLCQRALVLREKSLGPNHSDVAQSLNNLALVYYAQGQYSKAEPLYQRQVAILLKKHGLDHPDVARSLKSLEALQAALRVSNSVMPQFKSTQRFR
jgi:tetratricopeptide (TPR) repeat protein